MRFPNFPGRSPELVPEPPFACKYYTKPPKKGVPEQILYSFPESSWTSLPSAWFAGATPKIFPRTYGEKYRKKKHQLNPPPPHKSKQNEQLPFFENHYTHEIMIFELIIFRGLQLQLSGVFQINYHCSYSFLVFPAECQIQEIQDFSVIFCNYSYMISLFWILNVTISKRMAIPDVSS